MCDHLSVRECERTGIPRGSSYPPESSSTVVFHVRESHEKCCKCVTQYERLMEAESDKSPAMFVRVRQRDECNTASSPCRRASLDLLYLAAECLEIAVALRVGLIQRIVGVRSPQQSTPTKLVDVRRYQLAEKVFLKKQEPRSK